MKKKLLYVLFCPFKRSFLGRSELFGFSMSEALDVYLPFYFFSLVNWGATEPSKLCYLSFPLIIMAQFGGISNLSLWPQLIAFFRVMKAKLCMTFRCWIFHSLEPEDAMLKLYLQHLLLSKLKRVNDWKNIKLVFEVWKVMAVRRGQSTRL